MRNKNTVININPQFACNITGKSEYYPEHSEYSLKHSECSLTHSEYHQKHSEYPQKRLLQAMPAYEINIMLFIHELNIINNFKSIKL
jgi:glycyl-tRNA synthetase alpha subunit